MLPVSSARLARARTLSVPCECSVMPRVYRMVAGEVEANILAASTMSCAGTPVISSTVARSFSMTEASKAS